MEKQFVFCAFLLLTMSCVHAENRLFPTDILNQGEVDVDISVNHQTYSGDYIFQGQKFGTLKLNLTKEDFTVRYGLGSNWQIGANLPYFSHDKTVSTFNFPPGSIDNSIEEGRRNPVLRAAYGFLNDKISPLSLKGELFVTPNTTGKAKSTYTSSLVAGWKSSDAVKYYGSYTAASSVASNVRDDNGINLGAYVDVSNRVTLIPHAFYTQFYGIDNNIRSMRQNGLGLSSDIQMQRNTYLIPDVVFYRDSSRASNHNQVPSVNGKSITLALYHLF